MPKRKPGPTPRAQWLGKQGEYLQLAPSMVSQTVPSGYGGLRTVFTVTPVGTSSPGTLSSSRL